MGRQALFYELGTQFIYCKLLIFLEGLVNGRRPCNAARVGSSVIYPFIGI